MTAVIVTLVISMILLFASMVMSAMSASAAQKGDTSSARTYAMWSAVVSGLSIVLLIVILALYLNSQKIVAGTHAALGQVSSGAAAGQAALGQYMR